MGQNVVRTDKFWLRSGRISSSMTTLRQSFGNCLVKNWATVELTGIAEGTFREQVASICSGSLGGIYHFCDSRHLHGRHHLNTTLLTTCNREMGMSLHQKYTCVQRNTCHNPKGCGKAPQENHISVSRAGYDAFGFDKGDAASAAMAHVPRFPAPPSRTPKLPWRPRDGPRKSLRPCRRAMHKARAPTARRSSVASPSRSGTRNPPQLSGVLVGVLRLAW